VRRACIDIGSNTTRLLVAERDGDQLREIHQERQFTHIGQGLGEAGTLSQAKIAQVAEVVATQVRTARKLGAAEVHGVATAAIRGATNGDELAAAIRAACGLDVRILSGEAEARLAFIGAARTLGHRPNGDLGVVDVGGGSSELVVGTAPDHVNWCASFAVGSGELARACLRSDPPSAAELSRAQAEVARAVAGLQVPHSAAAVAVGGSATSLRRLAGPLLDSEAFARSLKLLAAERASDVSRRFALDVERVRLLPAGLLILQAASELFGAALLVARGGLREGVLLEATDG
jgi:exopolyphosphatase/guanosine-5'-triphosphate,3'-diphosphate pyrophosphatase